MESFQFQHPLFGFLDTLGPANHEHLFLEKFHSASLLSSHSLTCLRSYLYLRTTWAIWSIPGHSLPSWDGCGGQRGWHPCGRSWIWQPVLCCSQSSDMFPCTAAPKLKACHNMSGGKAEMRIWRDNFQSRADSLLRVPRRGRSGIWATGKKGFLCLGLVSPPPLAGERNQGTSWQFGEMVVLKIVAIHFLGAVKYFHELQSWVNSRTWFSSIPLKKSK